MAFMWSGYLPILMFRHVTSHCLYAIRSGGALFYHRDITPFDVVIARIGLEVMGNFAATALSFYLFYMIGVIEWPHESESVPARVFLHGLVVGFRSYDRRCLERAERHRGTYLACRYHTYTCRFPASFILLNGFRSRCASLALTVMPSLHCYEMIRGGLFGSRLQVFYDLSYLSFVLAVLTLFGLWLLRGVRQYIQFD